MNKSLLTGLVMGCFLAVSTSAAFAQGRYDDHGRGRGPDYRGHPPPPAYRHPGPPMGHRPPPPVVYRADPPYRHWGRGDVVPMPYRGPQYVVSDWRGHRLSAPPRGYRWVNVGADYFLIGVATGVVLQSILNP